MFCVVVYYVCVDCVLVAAVCFGCNLFIRFVKAFVCCWLLVYDIVLCSLRGVGFLVCWCVLACNLCDFGGFDLVAGLLVARGAFGVGR